jgi:HlyD family secretion protein
VNDDKDPQRPDLSGLKIEERSRSTGGRSRWLIATIGVAVVVIAGAFLLVARGRRPEVEVAAAQPAGPGGAATLLNASGYVTPRRRATVAAKITARVVDVYVDEGMTVKQGQLLARLDDSDAQRRVAAARATRDATAAAIVSLQVNLANAKVELRRQQHLESAGYTTEQDLDQARTTAASLAAQIDAAKEQVRAAEAEIAVAQQDVDNCTVRAPFAGVVVSKDAQRGEMVSPISAGGGFTRTGIATIVDMNSLEIEVDVNEAYIARVVPGQPVVATLDAYPDWKIAAHVRTIIPTADRQKATVKVRISFEKLDPRILPDMGVKVAFLAESAGATPAPRAVIAHEAVREEGGGDVVFVVHEDRLERRAVSLGEVRGSDVEVLAGVEAGEEVVVKGPAELHDGERVKVKRSAR